jgi:hypothetical protein
MWTGLGYLVLGPDYFFGDAVPNHPPGRDMQTWLAHATKPAVDAFPTWLESVKAKYGACLVPTWHNIFMIYAGTEETKYCAVGMSVHKQR